MISKSINFILRIAGFAITVLLLVQPWLIKVESVYPFLYSGWFQIAASFVAILTSSLVLCFYRPHKAFNPLTIILFILFIAISVSLYYTNYNVCLRVSMLALGLISCVGGLRLFRKSIDNYSIAGMVALSGFFMSIYAICQYFGYDFLLWEERYNVVGTLTNPNFLGIFLCMTASITFGLVAEFFRKDLKQSLVFLSFFIVQIAVIILLDKAGLYISLAFMALIWLWSRWFNLPGRIARISPVFIGLIISIIFLSIQWFVCNEISKYPWEKITKVPYKAQAFVSRLILWNIGFDIYKEHPFIGTGAGSIQYIMPLKRPPTASLLGLNIYNDDPHSFIISVVTETGFLGLWGICSLLVFIIGSYIRKKSKYEAIDSDNIGLGTKEGNNGDEINDDENASVKSRTIKFPWAHTLVALLIIYLSYKSGYIIQNYLPFVIAFVLLFFGICSSTINDSFVANKNDYYFLGRATLTAIFTYFFYSLFNNTFSILPLAGFAVMLISLHFSCCQPDVRFKPRITLVSLLFIVLPIIYIYATSKFETAFYHEQIYLYEGDESYQQGDYKKSEQAFLNAININPQCLKAYNGLAVALEGQGRDDEAQDVFTQLDVMVPNIYNAKYEIARILFENHKVLEAHRYAVKNLEWAEDPKSYELLGNILKMEGKYKEAEQIFKEGLISIPANKEERLAADRIKLNLAALAFDKGDYILCKKYLSMIKSEVGENIDSLYMKGFLLLNEKKYDEALKAFELALNFYPESPRLLNATGYILMITDKDLDRSQLLLEQAFKILKNNENHNNLLDYLMVSNSLGKLYQKQNKLDRARELLKIAYEETPDEYPALKAERLKDLNELYNSFGNSQ